MSEEIYLPKGAIGLESYIGMQMRLGLQGFPKSGKTFSALAFPNPIVLSFDRGLIAHVGRKDVHEIPLYDTKFCDSLVTRSPADPPNRKEVVIKWLNQEGIKLKKSQTLIVDGNTGLQASFHSWYRANPVYSKSSGEEDKYAQWRLKQEFYSELMLILKSLVCDVVFISHESPDRDNKGDLNGQLRPLLTGQFVDELASHFTDWLGAVIAAKPNGDSERETFLKKYGINLTTYTEWMKQTPSECRAIYLWQTQPDQLRPSIGTSLIGAPKYILAGAESFRKYQRQETSTHVK